MMSTDVQLRPVGVAPFADNEEFLEAMFAEVRMQIRCAGLHRQMQLCQQGYWGPGASAEGEQSQDELERELERVECQYRKSQAYTASRLCASKDIEIPWCNLIEQCVLDPIAQQVLWLLFFNAISPDFRELMSNWELDEGGSRGAERMQVATILQILCTGALLQQMEVRRHFSMDAPLVVKHLIKLDDFTASTSSILAVEVEIVPRMIAWISGDNHRYIGDSFLHIERPQNTLDQVVLPQATLDQVLPLIEHFDQYRNKRQELGLDRIITYGRGVAILEYGPPGTGKTLLARALAHHTGRPLVSLQMQQVHQAGRYWTPEETLAGLFREAELLGGIVFIDECDQVCGAKSSSLPYMLVELERTDSIVIMATNRPEELAPELDRRFTLKIPFGLPDVAARQCIWQEHLRDIPLGSNVDLEDLAHRFPQAGGYIKNAVLAAVNSALSRHLESATDFLLGQQDLEQASRLQEKHIGGVSRYRKIIRPKIKLKDLAVSQQDIEKLAHLSRMISNYRAVLKRWQVQYECGFRALLSGSSIEKLQQVVEGLAGDLDTAVELVSLSELVHPNKDEVKGVTLLQMDVFNSVSGTGHLLVFQDDQHLLEALAKGEDNQEFISFFNQLAAFGGAALMITTARCVRLPLRSCLKTGKFVFVSLPTDES